MCPSSARAENKNKEYGQKYHKYKSNLQRRYQYWTKTNMHICYKIYSCNTQSVCHDCIIYRSTKFGPNDNDGLMWYIQTQMITDEILNKRQENRF